MMSPRRSTIVLAVLAAALVAACDKPTDMRPLDPPDAAHVLADRPTGAPRKGAWLMIGGVAKQARFLCDGIDRPRIIVVLEPNAAGVSTVATYDKAKPHTPSLQTLSLGPGDPGAGQVYYALSRDGRVVGSVHTFNPGALEDPSAGALSTLSSITLDDVATRCRWIAHARFVGFTDRRSLAVSRTAKGALAYTTFDFHAAPSLALVEDGPTQTTAASLDLETGVQDAKKTGPVVWHFDNETYGYAVTVGTHSAQVDVSLGGAPIQMEPFVGYAYAP